MIRYEKDPATRIATITFDRPDRLNAPTIAARIRSRWSVCGVPRAAASPTMTPSRRSSIAWSSVRLTTTSSRPAGVRCLTMRRSPVPPGSRSPTRARERLRRAASAASSEVPRRMRKSR